MPELVESVVRAAKVLRAFEPNSGAMTVREIAVRTGIPRSTAHALCNTLVHVRLLEVLPGSGYRLGPAAAWLGAQVFERTGLVEAAAPAMNGLVQMFGSHIELAQYVSKGWMVFLHHAEDPHLRASNRVGTRVPAHECAEGLAVFSGMQALEVQDILSAHNVQEYGDLLRLVSQAHARGFAILDRSRSVLRTIAAPILDPQGLAVGALSVSMNRQMFTERRTAALAQSIRAACHETSQRIATRGG